MKSISILENLFFKHRTFLVSLKCGRKKLGIVENDSNLIGLPCHFQKVQIAKTRKTTHTSNSWVQLQKSILEEPVVQSGLELVHLAAEDPLFSLVLKNLSIYVFPDTDNWLIDGTIVTSSLQINQWIIPIVFYHIFAKRWVSG